MRNRRAGTVGLMVGMLLTGACGRTAPEVRSEPADGGMPPGAGGARPVTVVPVVEQTLARDLRLPGELRPYQDVEVHARVEGFVESINVDMGSRVRRGQVMATIVAPELVAQHSEAEARTQSAIAQQLEAEAQLAADEATNTRLQAASASPGVIAGHELELAERAAEASRAHAQAARQIVAAAEQTVASLRAMEAYLEITSPFDGIVTQRQAHPGSLVGPSTPALVRVQDTARLRLAISIPEADIGGFVLIQMSPSQCRLFRPARSQVGSTAWPVSSIRRRGACSSRPTSRIRTGRWHRGCLPSSIGSASDRSRRCSSRPAPS